MEEVAVSPRMGSMMRSMSEVRQVKKELEPFNFNLLAIEPLSKAYYPSLAFWDAFRCGANISAEYDEQRHLILDKDIRKIAKCLKPVFAKTPIIETAKGHGIVLSGPVPQRFYSAMLAYRNAQKGLLDKVHDANYERSIPIVRRFRRLGIKDDTAIHGLFKSADGRTYYLLPPSVT